MFLPKALNAGGLALSAGPLLLVLALASPTTVTAQDYVDLEAERAAAQPAG